MSTLGRKAMKKTLEKLRVKANRNLEEYHKATEELDQARKQNKNDHAELYKFYVNSLATINSLVDYVNTLKDYSSELEATFDKLLKPKKQAKPTQKKRKTTGTPIV